MVDQFRRPHPRLPAGAEWLRPSLHLLHHPLWPRQFPQRADGRGGRGSAAADRKRLCRNRADRRGSDVLWRAICRARRPWAQLVAKILKLVPDLKRLRLSSIDSIEADPALMRAIAEEERLMPHFHLSAQSGDDLILKRMKRRHSRADTIAFCDDGAAAAPRSRFRRRPDRRLSHRNRSDVREQPEAGGRCRPYPACMSFPSARARHAGRAHAAAWRAIWSRNAARGCAPRAMPPARRARSAGRQRRSSVLVEKPRHRPHANVSRRSRSKATRHARQHCRRSPSPAGERDGQLLGDSRGMRISAKRRRKRPAFSRG